MASGEVACDLRPLIHMRTSPLWLRIGWSLLVGAAAPATIAGQAPVEVRVRPSPLMLEVGQRERLFVSAFDARGRLLSHPGFSFGTTDSAVAGVTATGIVSGKRAGSATIVVRAGFAVARVSVAVFRPEVPHVRRSVPQDMSGDWAELRPGGRVVLEPSPMLLLPGERQGLRAVVEWSDGSRRDDVGFRWQSTDTTVARMDAAGMVRALRVGNGRIAVWVDGAAADTAPVSVGEAEFRVGRTRLAMRPGDVDTVAVLVPTQQSRRLADGLSWRVLDSTVARVGPTGIVQALGLGATELIVQGFHQERRLPLVVHPPVSRLALVPSPGPDPITVPVLGSCRFTVLATTADAVPVPEALLQWEVADPAIAEFDATAKLLRGKGRGMTSLTLRVRGFDPIAWAIRVDTLPIIMESSTRALAPLASDTLLARFTARSGKPLGPASGLAWSSNPPGVVQVDSVGVITGVREGRATVAAATPWGTTVATTVYVAADLLLVIDRAQAGSAIVQVRSRNPSMVTEVLRDGAANRSPVYSPDRTRIAFASDVEGDFDVFVMEPDGRSRHRLAGGPGDQTHPSWTPDGRAVVFASWHDGQSEIAIADATAAAPRSLAVAPAGETYGHAAVSPDGLLAFLIAGSDGGDLAVLDLALGSQSLRRVAHEVDPEVRPIPLKGGRILFARGANGSGSSIFQLDLRSGKSAMIFTADRRITSMAVSRDGAVLTFVSNGRLRRMPLEGKRVTTLLSLPTFERVTDPSF